MAGGVCVSYYSPVTTWILERDVCGLCLLLIKVLLVDRHWISTAERKEREVGTLPIPRSYSLLVAILDL